MKLLLTLLLASAGAVVLYKVTHPSGIYYTMKLRKRGDVYSLSYFKACFLLTCSYIVDWEMCCTGQPMEPVENRKLALQEWGLLHYDPEGSQDKVELLVDF